jgi:Uncharacterized proteins involved in stress response, homologs of TerZ and putative cAMP-binding protein CABP1
VNLLKGQKIDVTKGRKLSALSFQFGWTMKKATMSIDAACFILSDKSRCERDEDFIFYGNPSDRYGAITHGASTQGVQETIQLQLSKLPASAAKVAFSVTIHAGDEQGHTIQDTSDFYLRVIDTTTGEELFRFEYGDDLSQETAIVVGELYRYNEEWKFNAVGSGFYGGLAALCTNYGLEVEPSEEFVEAAAAKEEIVLSKIDLRKKIVQITLEKKKIAHISARVGIVLDVTGSMQGLYKNGTVQEVVERILAVASKFDDNGALDVWVYDHEFSRLPSVTERDFNDYVTNQILSNSKIHKFGRNNEPQVMEDVIRKYTVEEQSSLPVFIIFINDGGVVKSTKKVIVDSAIQPIFWQFVGIGDSDFEVLKKLDSMEGRMVDNANFIHLEDISAVSDEMLYDQLLNEFPQWIKSATEKRIIR